MKITLFFLVISMLQLSAKTHAQTVTLNKVNAPLSEIFKAIRQQTDYDFVYSTRQMIGTKKITIMVNKATVFDVLDQCFINQPLNYIIDQKNILIKAKNITRTWKSLNKITKVINGKIFNEVGLPLEGATITVKGSDLSTLSDDSGTFKISPSEETGTLIISHTGFKTTELTYNSEQTYFTVKLQVALNDLNEIRIIGYGKTTKLLNTGSIATISARQIENQPVTNILSSLSGRMPGVFVQTTNGLPGGNINVQIRGKGSILAGNNPLYIVDGVPFDGASPNAANGVLAANNLTGPISPLSSLNPSEIESITVLKDADATSIYGSRGANGVVLITMKKGTEGQTSVEAKLSQGITVLADHPDILSSQEYLKMREEAFDNDNLIPSADPASASYAPDLTVWKKSASTDWIDYMVGNTARNTDFQFKVSGGSKQTHFNINVNHRDESTVLKGQNAFLRSGLKGQVIHKSFDGKLNIRFSNQISHVKNEMSNPVQGFTNAYLLAPNFPIYLPDGSFNWSYGVNTAAAMNSRSKVVNDNIMSNFEIGYYIFRNAEFKVNAGYNISTYDQILKFPTRALFPGTVNSTNFGKSSSQTWLAEPQVEYSLKINNSTFKLLAGGTYQARTSKNQIISASNYKLESLMEDLASAAAIDSRINADLPYKYVSLFGRATYNLNNFYLLNLTARRDGSSRFGPYNRFGNFASIGTALIFSNLEVIRENFHFLSYGKIRASFGTTGNDQIQDYQYQSTYSSPGTALYQDVAIIRPNRISNEDFHWETTQKTDVGLELGFLENRISLSTDYFRNSSKDQLVSYTLPQITGFSSYQANLPAVVVNKGWEFSLNTSVVENTEFRWSANFNITTISNKLKSFKGFEASSYASTYQLGYDITRIRGYKYLGADQQTGDPMYAGRDGQASTTPYDNFTLGKTTPEYFGGFGNTLDYKNFTLNVFAQFVKQTGFGSILYNPGVSVYNSFGLMRDRWSKDNQTAFLPRASTVYDSRFANSSVNVFNTSYLRLKNISLSYLLPSKIANKAKLRTLKLFADAQNVLTIWDKDIALLDPEPGGSSSSLTRNFPPVKTFILGIQLIL